MSSEGYKVCTPFYPTYATVERLVSIFNGVAKSRVMAMIQAIMDQTGTPQNPVDWTDPNTWIDERLKGDEAQLARRIWEESRETVNPRHIYGAYLFINNYNLLQPDGGGVYRVTERGEQFCQGAPEIIRELDEVEGLAEILSILSTKTKAKRSDLLAEWSAFLKKHSKFKTDSTHKDTLRRRLVNLGERGLVQREGISYNITESGMDYAATFSRLDKDPKHQVMRAVKTYNEQQKGALRERLGAMPAKQFEVLVGELLDAMGYQDVVVTKESGDKGVDVVATVQFGITTITEVVQVKRHQGSIGRPVLDQLRGALPYHKAIRGTLITLGNFSKGCTESAIFPGAAPITLINGEKLLDLLIEHHVGVKETAAPLYEVDEDFFLQPAEEEEQAAEVLDEGVKNS